MAVMDTVRDALPGGTPPTAKVPGATPPSIEAGLQRGREARDKNKALRVLYRKFWEGDQYWFLTPGGKLNYQTAGMTGVVAGGKPGYRVRNTYNFIQGIVEAKVSAATQQIPGYEVTPATDDPEDEAAAALASQVAIYGYDKWRVRRHTTQVVTDALVSREGFTMPYFDPDIGPVVNGEPQGEIRLLNLSRDEVMWEPDDDFDDSRWHAIERQRRLHDVEQLPGYIPGVLSSEDKSQWGGTNPSKVTVTEYLERPCRKYPEGRRMFFAAGKPIVDWQRTEDGKDSGTWWEPFPCMDADGQACDEPPMHRVSYTVNPHGDDFGLVERILDLQRTINDTWNKIIEIKNRALLLQMWVPKGAGTPRRDDTPGATYEYNAAQGGKPEWEPAPDPGLIQQLLLIHQQALEEMRQLAADVDIQPTARLAEGTAQLAQTSSAARWQSFLGDLAEFHSRLMRHCLTLVARHYDSARQIEIRGQYGWEPLPSFVNQDMRSQVNVRVLPGSLATKSREAIQAEIAFIQSNWPGAITPEAAQAALQGGSMDGLIKSYRNDMSKALRICKRIETGGPEVMESFGARWDPALPDLTPVEPVEQLNPETGEPLVDANGLPIPQPPQPQKMGVWVPNWMPGPWDRVEVWRTIIGDRMKTMNFEALDPGRQEHFYLIWQGLEDAEQQRAARQAAQQQMQAESLGMGNAGKPQMPPPTPDRAGFNPGDNQSAVPTA